jgi:two-component system, chemotaxis family, protein-glutamate methylesterase/glutaminase
MIVSPAVSANTDISAAVSHGSQHLPYRVVAIAASAGGFPAIRQVLSRLPADFPVPIVIVQHLHETFPSAMDRLLDARTPLSVRWAQPGDHLVPGTAYIATRGLHLTVDDAGVLALPDSPRVRSCRPSADVLFNSLATSFRARAIAVVLSGSGCDGGAGAGAMQRAGASVIAQDARTSLHFSMPHAAIVATTLHTVLPIEQIAPALVALASRGALS